MPDARQQAMNTCAWSWQTPLPRAKARAAESSTVGRAGLVAHGVADRCARSSRQCSLGRMPARAARRRRPRSPSSARVSGVVARDTPAARARPSSGSRGMSASVRSRRRRSTTMRISRCGSSTREQVHDVAVARRPAAMLSAGRVDASSSARAAPGRARREPQILHAVLHRLVVAVERFVTDVQLHAAPQSVARHQEVACDALAEVARCAPRNCIEVLVQAEPRRCRRSGRNAATPAARRRAARSRRTARCATAVQVRRRPATRSGAASAACRRAAPAARRRAAA